MPSLMLKTFFNFVLGRSFLSTSCTSVLEAM
jgi:hypothetical protein